MESYDLKLNQRASTLIDKINHPDEEEEGAFEKGQDAYGLDAYRTAMEQLRKEQLRNPRL